MPRAFFVTNTSSLYTLRASQLTCNGAVKLCKSCLVLKDPSDFHTHPKTYDRLNWRCISCQRAYNKQHSLNRTLAKCDPLVLAAFASAPVNRLRKFAIKVRVEQSGCWQWLGNCHPDTRYGRFWLDRHTDRLAHRLAYEWTVGPVPDGLVLDHLCRNRSCVNPIHLEPVTNVENVMRGESFGAVNARKTHCLNGHEFTPLNTRVTHQFANPGRSCRTCERDRKRKYRLNAKRSLSPL